MNIWNYDICVWHPPTFDTCLNFLCKRNYILKQVPTHLLKIRSFFWGLPWSSFPSQYTWLGPVTNGAKWYPKNGTIKDFSYQKTNSLDLVLEVSCCKYLRSYFLPREWDNNRCCCIVEIISFNDHLLWLLLFTPSKGESSSVPWILKHWYQRNSLWLFGRCYKRCNYQC